MQIRRSPFGFTLPILRLRVSPWSYHICRGLLRLSLKLPTNAFLHLLEERIYHFNVVLRCSYISWKMLLVLKIKVSWSFGSGTSARFWSLFLRFRALLGRVGMLYRLSIWRVHLHWYSNSWINVWKVRIIVIIVIQHFHEVWGIIANPMWIVDTQIKAVLFFCDSWYMTWSYWNRHIWIRLILVSWLHLIKTSLLLLLGNNFFLLQIFTLLRILRFA